MHVHVLYVHVQYYACRDIFLRGPIFYGYRSYLQLYNKWTQEIKASEQVHTTALTKIGPRKNFPILKRISVVYNIRNSILQVHVCIHNTKECMYGSLMGTPDVIGQR